MATNKKLEVTDLDFDSIKTNLKKFLRQQDQFTDYDFDGSTINTLLDVLAYNTHYNGVYANVLANEMFLDSADMRNSIVSHAKHVGYTPRSATAPYADVNLVVNNATGATLTASQGTTFTSTVEGVSYNYIVKEDTTTTPVDGVYTFKNLELYEGTLVTNKYTVNTTDANQRFLIKNDMADTTTLLVKVQNSSSDTTTTTYALSTDLANVSSTSAVYFLEGAEDEQYEVVFGDGVLGKALSTGNIVSLTYIVTNGSDSNGASSFALSGNVGGFTDVSLTVNTNSVNGADPESPASIRFNAPKQYATQNRAVTAKDYESKVKSIYSNAKSVQVWGGEDNETPVYGRVYISINPVAGATLTEATKSDIITQLKNFNVASITPVIENPETTFIQPTVTVRYDAKSTTNTAESIKSLVQTAITNFNTDNLQEFDQVFRHSKFIETVNKADDSILSNITTLKLHKSFTATLTSSTTYTISFNNALYNPHSGHNSDMGGILSSSSFKVSGDTTNDYFLNDDGQGNIRLYYVAGGVNVYTNNTQGTINYTTGKITLNSLHISEVGNVDGATSTTIRLTVVPNSVDVVPVRNQVIQIDETNATVVVTADDYDTTSGIGYTTATNYAS